MLRCVAVGVPTPLVQLLSDGTILALPSPQEAVLNKTAEDSDAGTYVCRARQPPSVGFWDSPAAVVTVACKSLWHVVWLSVGVCAQLV